MPIPSCATCAAFQNSHGFLRPAIGRPQAFACAQPSEVNVPPVAQKWSFPGALMLDSPRPGLILVLWLPPPGLLAPSCHAAGSASQDFRSGSRQVSKSLGFAAFCSRVHAELRRSLPVTVPGAGFFLRKGFPCFVPHEGGTPRSLDIDFYARTLSYHSHDPLLLSGSSWLALNFLRAVLFLWFCFLRWKRETPANLLSNVQIRR